MLNDSDNSDLHEVARLLQMQDKSWNEHLFVLDDEEEQQQAEIDEGLSDSDDDSTTLVVDAGEGNYIPVDALYTAGGGAVLRDPVLLQRARVQSSRTSTTTSKPPLLSKLLAEAGKNQMKEGSKGSLLELRAVEEEDTRVRLFVDGKRIALSSLLIRDLDHNHPR